MEDLGSPVSVRLQVANLVEGSERHGSSLDCQFEDPPEVVE